MPYGFIRSIEQKGYSDETIKSYERVVSQFFVFIKQLYPDSKEPHEINPLDIKQYLDGQIDNDKSISTVNKELAIIKTMFHYFWENNIVPIDPTVKIKRYAVKEKPVVEISYKVISSLVDKVLSNSDYSKLRKALFILAAKGLKTADFRFKKKDVIDHTFKDQVDIKLKNRKITLLDKEASYFLEYYYETLFNDSEYVFTTKPHGSDIGGPIEVMSILNHLRYISQDFLSDKKPLNLLVIRRAIAYDLYMKKLPIQQIAKELGIEEMTTSNFVKMLTSGANQKDLEEKNELSV
ncbi:tyrosine-type recombinase/integrase [Robertmurraya sp. FSL R5-0851]|uniref:tyrosine-type recombinase/integrase n=1 Tax=Robertmurraya sp. FSL R5-0851 TaxID=2921584 RepID=UPI0030FC5A6D